MQPPSRAALLRYRPALGSQAYRRPAEPLLRPALAWWMEFEEVTGSSSQTTERRLGASAQKGRTAHG